MSSIRLINGSAEQKIWREDRNVKNKVTSHIKFKIAVYCFTYDRLTYTHRSTKSSTYKII